MGTIGRPVGSESKERPFRDALRKRIAAAEANQDIRRLDRIAAKLLAKAEAGDMLAIKEVADRLDGKPAQATVVSGDSEAPLVHRIERAIIDKAEDTDS